MDGEQAYRKYFPLILAHSRRVLGDGAQAQDVAQDTFIRFLGARVEGGEPGVLAWLYRTSANLAIDTLRLRRRQSNVRVEELRPQPAPEVLEASSSLRATVERLSKSLPREVLSAGLLSRANGLTQPELALVLDVSERTVRRWLISFDEAARSLESEVSV